MSTAARPTCRIRQALRAQPRVARSSRAFNSSSQHQSDQADASKIAEGFVSKFAQGQTFVRKQNLDANQSRLFSLTLARPHLWSGSAPSLAESEPKQGTPLPPGYHLAYFTPAQLPGVLGIDGTDASFNPETPFTRRMWAGGSVAWPGGEPGPQQHHLTVGDTATEVTKVLSCEAKTIKKTGESMLVVGVEKQFLDGHDNLCVVDRRNWVFREALDPAKQAQITPRPNLLSEEKLSEIDAGSLVRKFNRDVVVLFRFSALTFNAHRIHYDSSWARDVEGHRNAVVHGPLNLVTMLDVWRDEIGGAGQEEVFYPKSIEYRATSPVYAGEGYRIVMNTDAAEKKQADMRVVSDDGSACMKGTIAHY